MAKFGKRSKYNLLSCDKRIVELFEEVVKEFDCSVLCGYRGQDEQDKAWNESKSTLRYPKSKHNSMPSMAVDVAPYPIDWDDTERFYYFAGYVKGVASQMGIGIIWGGDWDNDTKVRDNGFDDLVHFQIA